MLEWVTGDRWDSWYLDSDDVYGTCYASLEKQLRRGSRCLYLLIPGHQQRTIKLPKEADVEAYKEDLKHEIELMLDE